MKQGHGNRHLLTDVLKNELGFEGIVLSDWEGINEIPGDYKNCIEIAINAGIDMVMVPEKYESFYYRLKKLVEEKKIPMSRINDAVRGILRIKFLIGLFDHPFSDRFLTARIGSQEHRQVARQCVRASLVLLKNKRKLLPLPKNLRHIHVAGKNADNIGHQCGGWTITWQGGSGAITPGTTILQAIRQAVSPKTKVTYSRDGRKAKGAEVGIAVIGETPYAEFKGDRANLELDKQDLSTIDNLRKQKIPVGVVLISGRPLIITSELPKWDALIAAWLPGTEGKGVADVLFGDYKPTGKLSHTWPRTMGQVPINAGDRTYHPLFPYGFGLGY